MYDSPEILVHDELAPCAYLPEREARLPLRQPVLRLTGEQFDRRLAAGERRTGPFLYRTQCPSCSACIPIRLPVREFRPNRSQRRAARRADAQVSVRVQIPIADEQRVNLYNKHQQQRGLGDEHTLITGDQYRLFLLNSCCDTFEIEYRVEGELAAVAIVDQGASALSAVYCYFDPELAGLSLGVYSILTQLRLARRWGMDYLYLGLYIAESPHMRYKTGFRPYELRVGEEWIAGGADEAASGAATT